MEWLAEILSYSVGLVQGSSQTAKRASGDVMLAWERLKLLIVHSLKAWSSSELEQYFSDQEA